MKEACKTCVKIQCPIHPTYQAKHMPRCGCEDCWEMWVQKTNFTTENGLLYAEGKLITTLNADRIARLKGFAYAEQLVEQLEKEKK